VDLAAGRSAVSAADFAAVNFRADWAVRDLAVLELAAALMGALENAG
jgi:hypothetical protein